MAKFIGTIQKTDLEGGSWLLRTDQGVVYQLKGGDPSLRRVDQRVEIEGDIASEAMGIAMIGEILEVKSHRTL